MYRACGWQVVPSYLPAEAKNWKRPQLANWKHLQEEIVPAAAFERWYGQHGEHIQRPNMGLLTGRASQNVFVLDLDDYKTPSAQTWWQGVLSVHNNGMEPETCQQVTGGGGRQLFFQGPPGWQAPTNKTTIGVDLRGQAGFAVLPPSRHTSGNAYEWKAGAAPWEIEIAVAPDWLLQEITDLVAKHGGDSARGAGPQEHTESPGTEFNAFGTRVDLREKYMRDLIWASIVEWYLECPILPEEPASQALMLEKYDVYERRVKTRLDTSDGLEREGRGLTEFTSKWRHTMRQWDDEIAEASQYWEKRFGPEQEPSGPRASEPPPKPIIESPALPPEPALAPTLASAPVPAPIQLPALIPLQSAFPIAENSIPPRDWIIPGLLLKRHVTVLVAPPGSGKSLLTLQVAMACSIGRSWGGWEPRKAVKVLVVNAEDDMDEMKRRLLASAHEMKMDQGQLVDRILLADAPETIVIARTDGKSKTVIRTPLLEQLVETIKVNGVECVIVDPFAETFEGDENSNSEVKWAGILWREVGRRTGAAVFLVHHTKKYASGMAGEADASRGGGALIGTARILSTLFAMTEEEAKVLNILPEHRTKYVRFDDAKANLSLVSGKAKWFEKKTVPLNNGVGLIPGDDVGVLVPWSPPGVFDGISIATIHLVLDTIDRGLLNEDGMPTGQLYTMSENGKERWAGNVVETLFGCDEEKAKKVLKIWAEEGSIQEFEYHDPVVRKVRNAVKSNPAKRPGSPA